MKLSAVLIVKNEEDILAIALESVKDFDEIVVVDTGSTDATKEIASRYTDKVFDFPWIDDFAAARNFAIEKATGDWLYSIDADHELLTPVLQVKEEAQKAEDLGHKTTLVRSLMGKDDSHEHWREVLFKNDPSVRWHGKVHEVILPAGTHRVDVTRRCGYSKNHYADPDRNLRILESIEEKSPRTKFYLGREHYEKKHYEEAINWMVEYLKDDKYGWLPQIAEAHLVIARCHWFLNRGNDAREWCLKTININPDFKEALMFMGNLHYEPWKSKWHQLAQAATNKDVLFIRT